MNKELKTAANFRATVTVLVISVSVMLIIRKYTK